jgi:hypothetical protein
VPVQGRSVRAPARAEDRRGRRIRHGLVAAGELEDRRRRQVRRVRGGVRCLLCPLASVDLPLDRRLVRRCRHGRLPAQRDVFVEVREREVGHGVVERRGPRQEQEPDEAAEARREPSDLDDRPARDVEDAGAQVPLQPEQLRSVHAAKGLACVVDPRSAEVIGAVSVDVDTTPEHLHQLHQVDHGLAEAVAVRDQRVRRGGVDAGGAPFFSR